MEAVAFTVKTPESRYIDIDFKLVQLIRHIFTCRLPNVVFLVKTSTNKSTYFEDGTFKMATKFSTIKRNKEKLTKKNKNSPLV